jgi:cytochrome c biogenesis protein CcdA/thiol-disulfide isomerase/thioredoxin
MENTAINVGLAFLEGLGLIVSPCILPILPIILSGSIEGSKRRPLGIIFGFVIVFAVFTFFSHEIVVLSGIDLNIVRKLAFGLLIFLGVVMISDYLSEKFSRLTQRIGNVGANSKVLNNPDGGFLSGLLLGTLVALIWTPCAGPILASVLVGVAIQTTNYHSFLVLLAFAFGAIIPMLIIALFGRLIMERLGVVKRNTGLIRKLLGVVIILSVLYMAFSDYFTPAFATDAKSGSVHQTALMNGLAMPYPAPAVAGITAWINSAPLNLSELKGKVVLIDFWTYSCINCIRTLPYVKDWYAKYHDKGLVIIGVHSPEFDFEKNLDNIKAAVTKDGILYPVAVDNNYVTWLNYHNRYWPAHYLINKDGQVVYEHFGEGDYDTTENNIRFLLGLNEVSTDTAHSENLPDPMSSSTPETYVGTARAVHYSSPEVIAKAAIQAYTFPAELKLDAWALKGNWRILPEYIVSADNNAAIKIHFHAKHVYVVLGTKKGKPIPVSLMLNGEKLINEKGSDVVNSELTVTDHRLYDVVNQGQPADGILELTSGDSGLEVYTFTFGSK